LSQLPPAEAAVVRSALAAAAESVREANARAEQAEAVAERLRAVQDGTRRLSRSLGEAEVAAELGAQVVRLVSADVVSVLRVDLDGGTTETAWRAVRGVPVPRQTTEMVAGPILHAARTGRRQTVAARELLSGAGIDDLDLESLNLSSAVIVPMLANQRLEGVVVAAWMAKAPPAGADVALEALAAHGAAAIRNARLYAESERERRQSEALSSAATAVGESLRLGEVQRLILRHAMALLKSDGAALGLIEDRYIHIVSGVGAAAVLAGRLMPIDGSVSGQVVRDKTARIVNDTATEPGVFRPTQRAAQIRRVVVVPLITARGVVGVLAANDRDTPFSVEDARMLQRLADQCAVAIVNARLFEEARAATLEWKVLFDAVPSGVVVVDETGRIVRFNARALSLAGASAGQTLLGRPIGEVLVDDADSALPLPIADALLDGARHSAIVAAPQRGRLFDVVASPHPDGGVVVTFDDVTDLHALQARFRNLVETSNDAIVVTSEDRRIAFANAAAFALFGTDDLVGRPVSETVPLAMRQEVREAEDRAFAGERQRYETVVQRADGESRIVSVSSAPLADPGGRVTSLVASLRDVTEERRARDAIAKSEARYRNLFENATDAIYTLDRRGHITSANTAAARLAGTDESTMLGRSIAPFIALDDVERIQEEFARVVAGSETRFEARMRRADGSTRLLSIVNTPIREQGDVVGVLGIARDITDERTRELELARSEARYARLVDVAGDAIFTLDEAGVLTSANRVLERTVGLDRDVMIGQPFTLLLERSPDRDALWRVLHDTLRGEAQRTDFQYRDARNEMRTASLLATPIDSNGRVTGVLAVVRDVTDERRMQEQLQLQERLAAIGELVSGVAHEINNPLAGVIAHAQLLQAVPGLDADIADAANVIHGEARRASRIVSNLLTFARQHRPSRSFADIGTVLRDTLALRRYPQRVHNIEIVTEIAADLPSTWGDEGQLQQAFLNILVNAEHALEQHPGARRIEVRARPVESAIVVEICDTGPGIPSDVLPRIFNPFFTTKPVGKGTGLGLSLSDGIVREHGGRIEVFSSPTDGTRFRIELPVQGSPAPVDVPAEQPEPLRVLVADPDADARRLAARALADAGDAVLTIADVDEVLKVAVLRDWDVLLLDAALPGGAIALVERLAREAPSAAAKVVVSGASDAPTRALCVERGLPWLDKPYDLVTLPARLRGALS
jgi:PAS domain S-box-containing protein